MSNYFELFDLPCALPIDQKQLRDRYQTLLRTHHPDRIESLEDHEKLAAIQYVSTLNEAYRTLKESVTAAQYYLTLHGIESDERQHYPDLLMMQFELREALESTENDIMSLSAFQKKIDPLFQTAQHALFTAIQQQQWAIALKQLDALRYFAKLQEEIEQRLEKLF